LRAPVAAALVLSAVCAADGLVVRAGALASDASPTDPGYSDRFLTPGTTLGFRIDFDASGPLCFTLGAEKFSKKAAEGTGWNGKVSALLVSAFPSFRTGLPVVPGCSVFAGPGAVWVTGDYSGTDNFGRQVAASGSSLGFGFCAGLDIPIAGPVAGRLEYRRAFISVQLDKADIDGQSTMLFPAASADLGYGQFGFAAMIDLFGGGNSLLKGL